MFSHEYNLPVFIGTGSVLTSGDTSQLAPGQISLFNGKTATVVTGSVPANQAVFVASGSWHTKDKLNKFVGGLKESDKSIEFLGKDILEFHKSLPRKAQSEQWIIGWDGVSTDANATIKFKAGESRHFRVRVWGEDVYGTFLRPVDRFIEIKADCETTGECEDGCSDDVPAKVYAQRIADRINTDPELKYFLKAEVISSDAVAATPTHDLWCLSVCDTGDMQALSAVQTQFPGLGVQRISRSGSTSTYQFCLPKTAADPTDFAPVIPVALADCGECPAGYTLTEAKDVYVVQRVVASSTDLNTDADRQSFATTVATAYDNSSPVGTGKFLSLVNGVALVEITVTAGLTLTPINSDTVTFVRSIGETCVPDAATPIAWETCGERYKTTKKLNLTLEKVCGTEDRLDELIAFYANNPMVVADSVALKTTGTCSDVYEIEVYNNDCLIDGCLTEAIPQYDTLQSFEGFVWEDEIPAELTDAELQTALGVKVGVRVTAAYEDTRFGGCSFSPMDYYSVRPLKLEIHEFDDSGNACNNPVPSRKVRNSSLPTQTGEWVIRQYIRANKYKAFGAFYHDVRLREVLDANLHEVVDRQKVYVTYFLKVRQNRLYMNHNADFSPEIFEFMFAFPQGTDTSAFEQIISNFASQFGVYLQER